MSEWLENTISKVQNVSFIIQNVEKFWQPDYVKNFMGSKNRRYMC